MEELSIAARFLDRFLKGLVPDLKEKVLDVLLVIGTLVYQARHGRLSLQAWEENVWEATTPWIWLLCVLALYHVLKAARSLHREIRQGLYQSRKPFIIITDGEQTKVNPRYQLQLGGIVIMCVVILSTLSYLSWRLAQRITDSGTFDISDGSLAVVNMTQSLATKDSGWWWVTYKSYAGDTASPVALAQYMEITNLLSTPETIRTYSLAVRTEDCGWTYLSPIYLDAVTVWWTYEGLDKAIKIDFQNGSLNHILKSAIPAHGTVTGWWLFDCKVKCDAPQGSKIRYRVSLTTFSGIKFEYTTPEMILSSRANGPGNTEGRTTWPQLFVPPNAKADISGLYRRLWSSPAPK